MHAPFGLSDPYGPPREFSLTTAELVALRRETGDHLSEAVRSRAGEAVCQRRDGSLELCRFSAPQAGRQYAEVANLWRSSAICVADEGRARATGGERVHRRIRGRSNADHPRVIRSRLRVGQPRAQQVRAYLYSLLADGEPA